MIKNITYLKDFMNTFFPSDICCILIKPDDKDNNAFKVQMTSPYWRRTDSCKDNEILPFSLEIFYDICKNHSIVFRHYSVNSENLYVSVYNKLGNNVMDIMGPFEIIAKSFKEFECD